MEKNRVVVFDKISGRAKVFITNDPTNIIVGDNEEALVNPDLSYVKDVPPELWTRNEAGLVLPLIDELAIKERLSNLSIKPFADKTDSLIRENLANLTLMPGAIENYQDELKLQFMELHDKLDKIEQERQSDKIKEALEREKITNTVYMSLECINSKQFAIEKSEMRRDKAFAIGVLLIIILEIILLVKLY